MTGDWLVKAWSGAGRPDRARQGRRPHRARDRGVDGAAGRLDDGARRGGRLRRQDDQSRRGSGSLFCALFFVGLADLRRPLALRNLDLLALLSFSISLRLFNEGEIFWSVPLAYPPLVYLLARCVWIAGATGLRASRGRSGRCGCSPRAAIFLVGFRVGLNVEAQRSVIDVGFAGVVGAQADRERPDAVRSHAGRGGSEAVRAGRRRRARSASASRRTAAASASNPRGDTYGPISYLAYLPGYAVFGWSGKWDELWAAHATSLLFDALCVARAWRSSGSASAARGSRRRSRSPGRPIPSRSTSRTRTRTTRSCPRS